MNKKNNKKKDTNLFKNVILNNNQEEIESNSNNTHKTHVKAFNDRYDQNSNHKSHNPIKDKNHKTSNFIEADKNSNRGALTHNPNITLEFKIPRNYKANVQLTLGQEDNQKDSEDEENDLKCSVQYTKLNEKYDQLKAQIDEERFCRSSFDSEGSLFDKDLPDETKKSKNEFGNKTQSVFEFSSRQKQPGVIGEGYYKAANKKKMKKVGSINERDQKNNVFSELG